VVTGGSGGAGLFVIPELLAHGYAVINADRVAAPRPCCPFVQTDATDLNAVIAVCVGAHAIVHLAAIPAPSPPESEVWRVNMTSAWNVLEAAEHNGIDKVVMASSVNALGASWGDKIQPLYFPIDEDHPTRAQDVYSLSKHLGEEMAAAYARRRPMQIASMRFHWLVSPEAAEEASRRWLSEDATASAATGFWAWTGRHDAARACRLALDDVSSSPDNPCTNSAV
jgi:nucleoside-diphosphate-sugar epimerase